MTFSGVSAHAFWVAIGIGVAIIEVVCSAGKEKKVRVRGRKSILTGGELLRWSAFCG